VPQGALVAAITCKVWYVVASLITPHCSFFAEITAHIVAAMNELMQQQTLNPKPLLGSPLSATP